MPAPDSDTSWDKENCYWYAIGLRKENAGKCSSNPGDLSKFDYEDFSAANLDDALISDGALRAGDLHSRVMPERGAREGHYLIACKTGGFGFHVIRRDEKVDGQWYQKVPDSEPGLFNFWEQNDTPHSGRWSSKKVSEMFPDWVGYYWIPEAGLRPHPVAAPHPAEAPPPPPAPHKCCVIL